MARATQRRVERFLTREFLEFIGYTVRPCRSADRPDVRATLVTGGKMLRVGIEVTDYQVDASPSDKDGSPGRRLHEVWRIVQTSIRRRVARRRILDHTTGHVVLNKQNPPSGRVARDLAAELVQVALASPVRPDEERSISSFPAKFPLLQKHVKRADLHGTGCAVRMSWRCGTTSASHIGVVLSHVEDIIRRKNAKARKYVPHGIDQLWLLICAHGYPIFCTAGPHPEFVDWDSPGILSACQQTVFDRIYFWDRMYEWCKPLRPESSIVQKEWRVGKGRPKDVKSSSVITS